MRKQKASFKECFLENKKKTNQSTQPHSLCAQHVVTFMHRAGLCEQGDSPVPGRTAWTETTSLDAVCELNLVC